MIKEDYLWDKTGEDADIETLENALQVFRYKETAPPELPAKVLPFRKEEPKPAPRRIFSFAVAAAACLAFGVIALGVWLQILNNSVQVNQANLTEKAEPEIVLPPEPQQASIVPKSVDSPVDNAGNLKQSSARKPVAARRNAPLAVPVKISQKIAKTRNAKAAKPNVARLTKEEQYAYDQLMLALSIAGSKFKLVKDKIDGGAEEKTDVLANGQ
ncbi:MAG TPA: hypothetical protein VK400_02145 [Pyrinomonadaceae bacterium]|nr:hypothetical protein [Pyrinomonadaceae bacterium]